MGEGFGGEWTHEYVCPSPFAVHLKPSQHCESAVLQCNVEGAENETEVTSVAVERVW